MEGTSFRKMKQAIDYDNEEDHDWFDYLHEQVGPISSNLGSPFPDSSWSYARHDSLFDHEDNLKRSDDTIREEILKALYENQQVDASLIKVIVINANVLLEGKVFSNKARSKAQEIVANVPGVWKVENQLIIEQLS